MKFGPVPCNAALGAILAHSQWAGDTRLKKGQRLDEDAIAALAAAGFETVVVARPDPTDVGEDSAAARLAARTAGAGLSAGPAATGRVNLYAAEDGLFRADKTAVNALNAVDEALTLATLPDRTPVKAGTMVATAKVIPYAVDEAILRAAEQSFSEPALSLAPVTRRRAGLLLTTLPGMKESLHRKAETATRQRLDTLGMGLDRIRVVHHDPAALSEALSTWADLDMILVLGAAAIADRADVIPAALECAGGAVTQVGMPVDPGNLLALGWLGDVPVIGLPGCARSPKLNGADWVLARLAVGEPIDAPDIREMGVGGLLSDVPTRPGGREATARRTGTRRTGALLLAAGLSRRMWPENKLTVDLAGRPLVAHAGETLAAAGFDTVVAVTAPPETEAGAAVRAALADIPGIQFATNPAPDDGLAGSIRHGLAALDAVETIVIALGDMPRVEGATLRALAGAVAPEDGCAIAVPVYGDKRGNPVAFDAQYRPALQALSGDAGARSLIAAAGSAVVAVPVDDPGVLIDVDTADALAALRR